MPSPEERGIGFDKPRLIPARAFAVSLVLRRFGGRLLNRLGAVGGLLVLLRQVADRLDLAMLSPSFTTWALDDC